MSRQAFGALFAGILLVLFVYALAVAIRTANQCSGICLLGEGYSLVLETVGSLISAVVISELAVTQPNDIPGTAHLTLTDTPARKLTVRIIANLYLLIWLVSGITAFIVGYLQHANVVPSLTAVGKQWLGFTVAAAYAYFGLSAGERPIGGQH